MAGPICTPFPDYYNLGNELGTDQKMVMETVRTFVQNEVEPLIQQAWLDENFPTNIIPRLGELGLLGSSLTGYGLPGMDNISYGIVMKELERCDSGLRSFASVQGSLVMYPIHTFGSEEQKEKWLPLLGQGKAVGCFGLTEPDGGSDPAARAVPKSA